MDEARLPRDELARLPAGPGVYLFYDRRGELLYIGQSATLRARVRSYFAPAAKHSRRRRAMVRAVREIGYLTVSCDLAARLLESRLIKQRRPRYNVFLKSHRGFWFVRLDRREPFARLTVTHRPSADGADYYGPFRGRRTADLAADAVHWATRLRVCDGRLHPRADHPGCWYGELGLCLKPCDQSCGSDEYQRAVEQAEALLHGRPDGLLGLLAQRRDELSDALRYEAAAELQQRIDELARILARRERVSCAIDRHDVLVRRGDQVVVILSGRFGGTLDRRDEEFDQTLAGLVADPPAGGRLLTGDEIDELRLVAVWLAEQDQAELTYPVKAGARPHEG